MAFTGDDLFELLNEDGTPTGITKKRALVHRDGDLVIMRVAADGFLYNMVRILCGTLVSVSDGKIDEREIPDIILSKDRKRSGTTLVPEGLCLTRVVYPDDVFSPTYERRQKSFEG